MKPKKLTKPMKAPSKSVHMLLKGGDLSLLQFPLYASYKFDGVRATTQNDGVYSNTLKLIPNEFVQHTLGKNCELNNLDGELIVGEPNAPDVFRKTMSGVMSRDGSPDFTFYVFDDISGDAADMAYEARYEVLKDWEAEVIEPGWRVVVVKQTLIENVEQLLAFETKALELGYEGVMLRSPDALYKEGPARATLKEGELLKLKRFEDSEGEILELIEAKTNLNEANKNDLGQTKRSSHKAGKVAKGTLGAILMRDVHTGCEVTVGTGTLTKEQRQQWWDAPASVIGSIGVYKFFPSGSKDKPRHPTFKGMRDQIDITKKVKK